MTATNRPSLFLFLIFSLFFLLQSCGTTDEIVVVRDAPRADTIQEVEEEEELFYELRVGLIDPVINFDPLFARNLSTKRTLSLIYEGLFELDADGEPQPVIAREVTVSDDGLVYEITINREIFYHDSQVFTAGLGRRIHASDIKWAFERSARAGVPPMGAELLMNVRGFENYYLEQRSVYDEQNRVLDQVNGIQVVNAETIRIELNQRDPDFLHKLASPYLFIYPREALREDDGLIRNPVGTGPYTFNRIENEQTVVLVRSENNRNRENLPQINRIDLTYFDSESGLFQQFANGNIDWIPELGPEISAQVVDSDYQLQNAYRDSFELTTHNAERLTAFYLNNRSVVNQDWLKNRLALLTEEDISLRGNVSLYTDAFELTEDAEAQEEYYVAYTDNYVARALLTELHNLVFLPESSLAFFDIRVPTRRTSLYTQSNESFHQQYNPIDDGFWLRLDTNILSLHHKHVEGIQASSVPWSLHIKNIRVQDREMTP
jgi:ABC-type transport system substrate-binding protein